jgi:KipI family sensor histidine kinase inhibitor
VEVRAVGWSAVLVECDEPLSVAGWLAERLDATEIVPGERTVLLDGVTEPERVADLLRDYAAPEGRGRARHVELPTVYDGPDLDRVAEHWGVPPDEVVARHLVTEFTVAFCGFAPGFGYLTGLPWTVPRLASPRPKVPAGSVGLAGRYTGVYPSASPGGWLLIGHTDVPLFDVAAEPPALLAPGTTVRFVRA